MDSGMWYSWLSLLPEWFYSFSYICKDLSQHDHAEAILTAKRYNYALLRAQPTFWFNATPSSRSRTAESTSSDRTLSIFLRSAPGTYMTALLGRRRTDWSMLVRNNRRQMQQQQLILDLSSDGFMFRKTCIGDSPHYMRSRDSKYGFKTTAETKGETWRLSGSILMRTCGCVPALFGHMDARGSS